MAQIFPIDFDEKLTIAQNDFILFSDSEDGNKIKKAQYSNLKWEKWDTGATWPQWPQWETWPQWPQWETWPQWEQGEKWDTWETWATWARINSAAFSGNDIVFWETDWNTVTLANAKTTLTWPQWPQGEQWIQWEQWEQGIQWEQWEKWDKWDKGDTWTAATISVGTTTTWEPWTDASVTNSGTSSAAVFNFTIPQWAKWDTGATGATWATWAKINSASFSGDDMVFWLTDSSTVTLTWAKTTLTWPQGEQGIQGIQWPQGETWATGTAATITVWSTTTWAAWSSASVVNSWTSSAAVLDFTIPKGDKGDKWDTGNTWATGNWIASVTSSKSWKITTVTITETDWDSTSFQVSDGNDGEWAWDVLWPSSSTDWDIVLFDGATGKLIKDWSKALSDLVQTSWNQTIAWTKTFSTSPVVPNKTSTATNTWTAIATEAQVYTVADAVSTINWKISSNASSSNKLMDKTYIDDAINSVTAYYITKNAAWDQFATFAELSAATTFYSWWVVRIPTRNDYTIVLADEDHDNATTRYIYNSWWEYQYTINETAMSQAQLDALNSWITSGKVSTYDGYATTISGKQDALSLAAFPTSWHIVTWWANNKTFADGWAIPTVPTNVSDFTNDAGYITSSSLPWKATSSTTGTVKLWSDTTQSVAANAVSWTSSRTYAIQTNSSDQLVVNVPREDHTYTASSFDIKDLADSTNLRTTWNNKQNALTAQTAYTTKWTSTKVPTITTNTLWQVTAITETSIDFPVTSVNGSTWAVTVNGFNPWGTATTGYVLKKTADWYWWDAESWAVTSVNGQTGAVTVSEFSPAGSWSTGQVLTKTAGWYDWATPSSSTTTTATLTTAGWSSKEQTVSVTGVTASNTIIVSPAPANINDYALCSIYCSAQGSGTLTFKCNTVPSDAITVNVLILS